VGVLSRVSGDTASSVTEGVTYTVSEGDTINFRVRYTLSGVNGTWKEITITNIVGKVVPDDKQVSPTATRNISAN
jgi:hypothetical protein